MAPELQIVLLYVVQKFCLCLRNQLDEPVFSLIRVILLVSDNQHNWKLGLAACMNVTASQVTWNALWWVVLINGEFYIHTVTLIHMNITILEECLLLCCCTGRGCKVSSFVVSENLLKLKLGSHATCISHSWYLYLPEPLLSYSSIIEALGGIRSLYIALK